MRPCLGGTHQSSDPVSAVLARPCLGGTHQTLVSLWRSAAGWSADRSSAATMLGRSTRLARGCVTRPRSVATV